MYDAGTAPKKSGNQTFPCLDYTGVRPLLNFPQAMLALLSTCQEGINWQYYRELFGMLNRGVGLEATDVKCKYINIS